MMLELTSSSGLPLRNLGRKLRLFAALPLLLLATGPRLSEVSRAEAGPVPAVLATSAPSGLTVPVTVTTAAAFQGAQGLSPQVLSKALDAVACARSRGISGRDDVLTVIDYSRSSIQPRLWVLDLAHGKVLFQELVAHGAGSGDVYATRFSNTMDSRQTSLGLFLTGGTYEGGNGYSLKLRGLDSGVNDRAEERSIVMHGAWYVSADHARQFGRLGRSWGCPALSQEIAPRVIDTIKGGSFVFSYAADKGWLQASTASSRSAQTCGGAAAPTATALAAVTTTAR